MEELEGLKDYSYDRKRFGHILDYDRHSLVLRGERVFVFGGEFHYWRVPDRERWRDVLLQYKAGGLNCVRIYFHWGWHSPDEGRYIFEGNRDIDALFRLCEELGLYVLCAPGPYICAETSGGGFPAWLLARREVRIRHLKRTARKLYDPEFARYSRQWMQAFVSVMKDHEITTRPGGCVIGLQIENELFRKKVVRLGLDRHMEDLARDARAFGATVPLFHNDAMLMGSWVGGKDPRAAAVDWYGFDSYIIWCPQRIRSARRGTGEPPQWKNRQFSRRVDRKEKEFRGCGGWNRHTPLFVPELQGGWFNQWCVDHGFDEIYGFYGDDYTRAVVESFIAQGLSMFSLYMYHGGTNWGAVGDPDVYTSYDYSACIREYGYLSGRLRKLRLTRLFVRSMERDLLESEAVEPMAASCSLRDVLVRHRRSPSGVDFYFFRNFNPARGTAFEVRLPGGERARGSLPYRASFVGVGNLRVPGFHLKLATLPLLARMPLDDGELWVVQAGEGELLFGQADLTVSGNAELERRDGAACVRFLRHGAARLTAGDGRALTLLALPEEDALTLTADFEDREIRRIAWGAYSLLFHRGKLVVETVRPSVVRFVGAGIPEGFRPAGDETLVQLRSRAFDPGADASADPLPLGPWSRRPVDWDDALCGPGWKPVDMKTGRDPLDHLYTSGHVLYRCRFAPASGTLSLKLNIRHRAVVWVNGRCAGGHHTYGLEVLRPGAKNGPDPSFLGARRYDLGPFLVPGRENALVVLVESLGCNRGPGVLNDFRNPRGILKASFRGRVREPRWEIAGIDVRTLDDVFNTAGLPGERAGLHRGEGEGWSPLDGPPRPRPDDRLVWYRTAFRKTWDESTREPLRAHLEGRHSAHLFVNGLYVGRYAGDMGPQHDFYVPDRLVREGENTVVLATYTTSDDPFVFRIEPYRVDPASGSIRESGPVFRARRETVPLEQG